MIYRFYPPQQSHAVADFVAKRISGCGRGFDPCVAMSVGEPMIAGVVFHNWSPESMVMEMSAAADSPRWLSRPVIRAMHNYIFDTAKCQMAVLRVSERNKRMLRIADRVGYQAYKVPRLRGRYEDEIILTLTDDDWRSGRYSGNEPDIGKALSPRAA